MSDPPILFFDGTCGLCNRAVDFLVRHDHRRRLRFAPLQGSTARERLTEFTGLPDSLVLLDADCVRIRSAAAIAAVDRLGGIWRVINVVRVIPRTLRDAIYDGIAVRRYRWFGRSDHCRVPSLEESERFLP